MQKCAVRTNITSYPEFPFTPSEKYPEYKYSEISISGNEIYAEVRKLFVDLGLDVKNFGTPDWNPLGEFIHPGQKVLIKPNWVMDNNPIDSDITSLITHTSLIRTVIDYCLIALKGSGTITVGDASLQTANFEKIRRITNIDNLVEYYNNEKTGILIQVSDMRLEKAVFNPVTYTVTGLEKVNSVKDFYPVDLGNSSYLSAISDKFENYRVTNYNKKEMSSHHNKEKNEYLIHKNVIEADLVIELPKLKSHRKTGMTCALKNFVGINGHKDWLPHYNAQGTIEGGDNYKGKSTIKDLYQKFYESEFEQEYFPKRIIHWLIKNVLKIFSKFSKTLYFEGSWYGNDTLWRTVGDLNKLVIFSDKHGLMQSSPQRKVLALVDAVVAGEKEGPLEPSSCKIGALVIGDNSCVTDLVCSKLIGFDYHKIPIIFNTLSTLGNLKSSIEVENLVVFLNSEKRKFKDLPVLHAMEPSTGWKGFIELND
jgi:uncharacterized protein (DUF362 family)